MSFLHLFLFVPEDHIRSFAVIAVILFFFFFQAEDGIRDSSVTGVQTCALPISPETVGLPNGTHAIALSAGTILIYGDDLLVGKQSDSLRCHGGEIVSGKQRRSEERRVGKECRSRWSPYH